MSLTIGVPAKFQVNARFTQNLVDSVEALRQTGLIVKVKFLIGKSNLSHARSIMVTEWYDQAKPNDLYMFIDSDHIFSESDIMRVLDLKGDIKAGIYANRSLQPTSIPEQKTFSTAENVPLLFAGTGFLCFSYESIQKIHEYMKLKENLDRVIISDNIPIEENCIPFFNSIIADANNNGKLYWLGEDYSFSLRARNAGLKITGAIIHSLGHEMPFIVNYNKPIRGPTKWPAKSIVYYCGNSRVKFSPEDKSLGGSEQAVVYLSKELAKRNYKVTVYGNVSPCLKDGVQYLRYEEFNVKDEFNIIILWRRYGLEILGPLEHANAVYVDLHDPTNPSSLPKELITNKVKKIFVKSNFHRTFYPYLPDSLFEVIANGTQMENIDIPNRNKNRFCYTSCYERGLIPILKYLWPIVRSQIKDSEFHIYYGSSLISEQSKKELAPLLKQEGVFEHGRVSHEEVIKERYRSFAQIYLTDTPLEIDCISVREAAIAGCIPILSPAGVFKERAGVHIEGDLKLIETYEKASTAILKLYNLQDDKMEKFRSALKTNSLKQDWAETADLWVKHLPPTS
jgi:hypothetical protein